VTLTSEVFHFDVLRPLLGQRRSSRPVRTLRERVRGFGRGEVSNAFQHVEGRTRRKAGKSLPQCRRPLDLIAITTGWPQARSPWYRATVRNGTKAAPPPAQLVHRIRGIQDGREGAIELPNEDHIDAALAG